MADEVEHNKIDSEGRGRSTSKGDVPDTLRRRYFLDERGGPGLGFYVDARVQTPAFRDRGAQLVAARNNPNAIRDMTAIAQHRGWTSVVVRGDADFRREAWLAAMAVGIQAMGYRATERDRQELTRRQAAQQRKAERGVGPPPETGDRRNADAAKANLRIVETVVRARVASHPDQERILAAARGRVARWLERGARLEPVGLRPTQAAERDAARPRERQRGR